MPAAVSSYRCRLPGGGGVNAIWFAGDPHGSLRHILWHLEQTPISARPAAIILLGDITPPEPLEKEIKPFLAAGVDVRWIRGNHDTDTEQNWRSVQGAMDRNIDGKVIEVCGVRVAGLGGVFRGVVWFPPDPPSYSSLDAYQEALTAKQPARLRASLNEFSNGNLRKHQSTIFPDVVKRLRKQQADILVTHEPPAPHPFGQQVLADLARDMGARLHAHGHTHDALPYPLTTTGCRVLGVGLRGITRVTCDELIGQGPMRGISDGNGKVIRPGELDIDHLRTFERHGGFKS